MDLKTTISWSCWTIKKKMLAAYQKIVADSEPGDSILLHHSGHGSKIKDDDWGEQEDGYGEVLVSLDYQNAGMIRDDGLYDIIVERVSKELTN
jgi:hypothetical protein